jgi:CheY-like chemotaxis protein
VSGASNNTPTRRKRVLIAEDDAAIAMLLQRALTRDYDVVLADDGPSALAKAALQPHPEVVLLDIMMPGIDGFGVADRLRMMPALKKVPILFITARGGAMDVVRGIQHGARAYITKPFKLDDVLSKVKKAAGD